MNKATQRVKILEYMRTHHGRITTAEASDNLRIMSFTKRISELRQRGVPITDEMVYYRKADGSAGHHKVYTLEEVANG